MFLDDKQDQTKDQSEPVMTRLDYHEIHITNNTRSLEKTIHL